MFILQLVLDFILRIYSYQALGEAVRINAPGEVTSLRALEQAIAALNAATPEVSAELLLALTWVESRHDPRAVSRVEGGHRKTGIPAWTTPPANVSGPFFCGPTQTEAGMSWDKCKSFQDATVAYQTTVVELNKWLAFCKKDLSCALSGYNGGVAGTKGNHKYANYILWRAKLIKKSIGLTTT